MDIIANIKDLGEQRLFLVPDATNPASRFFLVASQEGLDNPPVVLDLKDNDFVMEPGHQLVFCESEEEIFFNDKLKKLAEEVIKAIALGEDLSATDIPEHSDSHKPYDPELIDVRESPMSVQQVHLMINDGDINLSPDFQRNVVWDAKRRSRLIESILLRIPLPVFYFSQGKDGKLSVIDGLQRLTAIQCFLDNKLELCELEYLSELNGIKAKQLENTPAFQLYWRRLKLTKLSANVIQPGSPTKVRYDIFRRLNTGGLPLNNQELRNCMASPALRKALKQMVNSEDFKMATGGSVKDDRMGAQELALRFMRFWSWMRSKEGISAYKGDMEATLDDWTDNVSQLNQFDFKVCEDAFKRGMANSYYLFGRHSFRKVFSGYTDLSSRSVINKALFISFSVVLSRFDPEEVKNNNERGSWIKLLADVIDSDTTESRNAMKLLSYGTNGVKNIKMAFSIAEMLAENLK